MRISRALSVILGLILTSGAIIGVVVLGSVVNPPRQRVVIANTLMEPGAVLDPAMLSVVDVEITDAVVGTLIREAEVTQYLGHPIVETLYPNEPVRKSAISLSGNPASVYRMSLAMTDPDLVAMPVPVSVTTAPNTLQIGDRVDIVFGATGADFGHPLLPEATAAPLVLLPGDGLPDAAPVAAAATPAVGAPLYGPITKIVVTGAQVLDIVRETSQSQTTDSQGRIVTINVPGPMQAILVLVPRRAQELLQFAIDNGTVRVSLLSALVQGADHREPSLGVVYNDLVALIELDRQRALEQGLPTEILGPGAAMYVSEPDVTNSGTVGTGEGVAPTRPVATPTSAPTRKP